MCVGVSKHSHQSRLKKACNLIKFRGMPSETSPAYVTTRVCTSGPVFQDIYIIFASSRPTIVLVLKYGTHRTLLAQLFQLGYCRCVHCLGPAVTLVFVLCLGVQQGLTGQTHQRTTGTYSGLLRYSLNWTCLARFYGSNCTRLRVKVARG